jgi:hypothetical protein
VTPAARDLLSLVRHLAHSARDKRSAVFVMELFRGTPTARNKAAVSAWWRRARVCVSVRACVCVCARVRVHR